jgi:hypothetical protein
MLEKRVFKIVLISPGHAKSLGLEKRADKEVQYNGKKLILKM